MKRSVMWRCAMAGALGLEVGGCGGRFVDAIPSRIGETSGQPRTGYLKIEVTSDFEAFRTAPYREVGKGFRFLSVAVRVDDRSTIDRDDTSGFPIMLYDLTGGENQTAMNVSAARGEYVDLDSLGQTTLTLVIRAVPETLGTVYADAFARLKVLTTGLPLSDLVQQTPYVALVGQILDNAAKSAQKDADRKMVTTAVLGLGTDVDDAALPLDGTPTAIFLQREDEPMALPQQGSVVMCRQWAGRLCTPAAAGQEVRYATMPYLVVRARTVDFRPQTDWAPKGTRWSCDLARREPDIDAMETALRATRFTRAQQDAEFKLLERMRLLNRAYALAAPFDLKDPDKLEVYAGVLHGWRHRRRSDGPLWTAHYVDVEREVDACFEAAMKSGSQQHEAVYGALENAYSAAAAFRAKNDFEQPLDEAWRKRLEGWLTEVLTPIQFLQIDAGETYGTLRAHQEQMEAILRRSDEELAKALANANEAAERRRLRAQVEQRLSTPCESCRLVLQKALADARLVDEKVARQETIAAQQAAASAQRELAEARQVAAQAVMVARMTGRAASPAAQQLEAMASAVRADGEPAQLEAAIRALSDATEQVRADVLQVEQATPQ